MLELGTPRELKSEGSDGDSWFTEVIFGAQSSPAPDFGTGDMYFEEQAALRNFFVPQQELWESRYWCDFCVCGCSATIHEVTFQLQVAICEQLIAKRGHFVEPLKADPGVTRDCLLAAMDDRIGWRKRAIGGRPSSSSTNCLTSHQLVNASQGQTCLANLMCCHTEIAVADQSVSPFHSIMIPGQPVLALTLSCQVPGKVIIIITLEGATPDFYDLLTAPWTVFNTYAQMATAQLCANHVGHIKRLPRATCHVASGTRRQLSY